MPQPTLALARAAAAAAAISKSEIKALASKININHGTQMNEERERRNIFVWSAKWAINNAFCGAKERGGEAS